MKLYVKDVFKAYRKKPILSGVSFEAHEGELIGIIGRNGCGKTTLLSILAGVTRADSGRILTDSDDLRFGYLPQTDPLLENISVLDNLKLWCKKGEALENTVRRFELTDMLKKKVCRLSGGMKRRLSLACALAEEPDVLLMDEPTSALDIRYKQQIHEEMRRFHEQGGVIIMVSHDKDEIDMCTKLFVLQNGVLDPTDKGGYSI